MPQNRPTVIDINCTTGNETVREMNDEEYEQYLIDEAANQAEQASKNASE